MSSNMRNLSIIVAIIGLFAWRGGFFASEVDDSVLRASGPDPCAVSEHCLAVYLAPWCPQCKQSAPLVEELRLAAARSNGRLGFKVIVGRDEPAALDDYARELGGTIFFDDDGAFYRQLGGNGVPTWVSWDSDGRIGGRMYGRPAGGPTPLLVEYLGEELGLSDVL